MGKYLQIERKVFKRKEFSPNSRTWREYAMNEKIRKKAEVIAAIALMLFSVLVFTGSAHALEPKKGTIDFVLLYKDVETNDSYFLSDVGVNMYDMNGNFVKYAVSSSNGIVDFPGITYGNYIIKTSPVVKNGYVYTTGYAYVRLGSNGATVISTGSAFTNITVDRYPLSHTLNLTVSKNGEPILADVQLSHDGFTYANCTVYGNREINVTEGLTTIKLVYNDGGVYKSYYREVMVSKGTDMVNVSMDIAGYQRVIGTVMSSGSIVNSTTHVIVINKTTGNVWKILTFNGGAFSFFLPSSNYKLVVKADGYSIATFNTISSVITAEVTPVTRDVAYNIAFSSNMEWMNVTYSSVITNETVLYGLPYADAGVLYYQVKLLGWTENDLKNFVVNMYTHYSDNLMKVNGDIYELAATPAPGFHAVDAKNMKYEVTVHANYYNEDLNKAKLIKDGAITLALNAEMNHVAGEELQYTYTITIPGDLERSNEISSSVATVSGYVGKITVSNVQSTPVNIVLKERQSPKITLDKEHLVIGWANMSDVNHIVNQSADNYTVVVPGSKQVWINASKMAYDMVRDMYDSENMTYMWILNGKALGAPVKGNANVTLSPLGAKKNLLTIKVTDIGGNTNETNITLLSDNAHPTVNFTVKDPAGKVLLHVWEKNGTSESARLYYTTNASDKIHVMAIKNGVAVLPVHLIFNQTEEIVYDAASSFDTFNYVNKTGLPVIVEWNFNGNKSTGANRTYAFDKPTRNGTYCVNVTLSDSVNNTVKISMKVIVRDITKPIVRLNFTANGKNVDEVKEGENVTLDATGSYDPDNGTIANYNWTIKDENYNVIKPTDKVYEIVNGSFASGNVTLKFLKFGTYYIILNITDGAGNYNVINKTLRVTPVRPDLSINSVNIKGDRYEGAKLTFVVNVSNNGNAPAKSFWVALYVNGKAVYNHTYGELKNGSYKIVDAYWVPPSPNNYTVTVKVGCKDEPSSYLSDNSKKETVKVDMAPWKLPAMIGGSIAIIALVGFVAWRYFQHKGDKKKFKKNPKNKGGKESGKKEKGGKKE